MMKIILSIIILLVLLLFLVILHLVIIYVLFAKNFGALVTIYADDNDYDYFKQKFMKRVKQDFVVDIKKVWNNEKELKCFIDMFNNKHSIIDSNRNNKRFTMSEYAFDLAYKYPKCIFYKIINKTLFSASYETKLEIDPLTGIVYETSKLNKEGV